MGSGFIEPHSGRQMFLPIDHKRIKWASFTSDLSPIGALICCSTGTKGVIPIDHTLMIKSMRAYKINIQFQSQVFINNIQNKCHCCHLECFKCVLTRSVGHRDRVTNSFGTEQYIYNLRNYTTNVLK